MIKIFKKRGETLVEVVVSLTILMMSGIAATSMIIAAIQTTTLSKNYLIAQSLATEAVEALKNIRGTNWLIYAGYEEKCWMVTKKFTAGALNDPTSECPAYSITAGNHIISRADDLPVAGQEGKWMTSATGLPSLDLETNGHEPFYALHLVEDPTTLIKRYRHDSTATSTPQFYREVKITHIDDQYLKFNVKIQWEQGAKVYTFEANDLSITNYL